MSKFKVGDIVVSRRCRGFFKVVNIQRRWKKKGGMTWETVYEDAHIADRDVEIDSYIHYVMIAKEEGNLTPKARTIHIHEEFNIELALTFIPRKLDSLERKSKALISLLKTI